LVPWKDDEAYEDAYAMMEKTVVQRLEAGNILGTKQQYLKHGSCQTVSKYRTEPPRPLGNREEWAEIRSILINEYASWETVDGFRLKVTCDYSAVQIDPLDDKSHYAHMAEELDNKMKENFQTRRYIPRIDLMKIVTNESIRRTIESHKSYLMLRQQIGVESGEAFIGRVRRDARTLLAICVYLDLDMNCLKMFLDADITDSSLPLNESHCPHDKYKRKFRQLLDNQGSFIAHEFVKEGEHHEVDSRVVVPIIFKNEVGGGGFATVYQGQVDPDHLHFAKDKKQVFAVKEFREHSSIPTGFQREQSVLARLRRYPHPHIVVHLASWIQDRRYYILFPLAQCNLREYMLENPIPILTKSFVLWILQQFHGLSDALRIIHNLREPQTGQSLAAPGKRGVEQGYHHDIKPENILYFPLHGPEDGKFKISDFGLGKVNVLRSANINESHWTKPINAQPTYSAPEGDRGSISRPADLWSIGCVFLELLIWIFVPTEPAEEAFANARDGLIRPHILPVPKDTDDAFWSVNEAGDPFLRPGVVEWISRMKNLCSGKRAFQRVLQCTEKLLEPVVSKRLSALNCMNELDALVKQTAGDLEENSRLYLEQHATFPTESMVPLLYTHPPSPNISPSTSSRTPPQDIVLPNTATAFDASFSPGGLVLSPLDDSPLPGSGLPRRPSYGMNLTPTNPSNNFIGSRSRGNSASSAISFASGATKGTPHGSLDDYNDAMDIQESMQG